MPPLNMLQSNLDTDNAIIHCVLPKIAITKTQIFFQKFYHNIRSIKIEDLTELHYVFGAKFPVLS